VPGATREFQLGMWTPALAPPRLDTLGRVTWRAVPEWSADRSRLLGRLDRGQDTLTAWRAEATDRAPLRPFLLSRIARIELAAGDTARAVQDLDALRQLAGPWQWEALRTLTDVALARGNTRGADSLLAATTPSGWTDTERAAWLVRRARLRAELGDTTAAAQLARSVMQRTPAAAPARTAVKLLESFAAARRKPLALDDEILAADVDRLQAQPDDAARRLARVESASPAAERPVVALKLADVLRDARRFNDGLAAAKRATRSSDPVLRARGSLARARLLRDSDRETEAIAEYERLAHAAQAPPSRAHPPRSSSGSSSRRRGAMPPRVTRTASSCRSRARGGTRRGCGAGCCGSPRATPRGVPPNGRARPARATSSGARCSIARSIASARTVRCGRSRAASATASIAPRRARRSACAAGRAPRRPRRRGSRRHRGARSRPAPHGDRRDRRRDARAAAVDRGAAGHVAGLAAGSALEAARIAYAMGRTPTGIRLGQKALDASPRAALEPWTVIPWLYPAAFDSLYASLPRGAADSSHIDVETLRAVAWQESRFDPAARSRSNALGLYQLKLATAGDVARRLGEPPPTEAALLDPARSLRFGRGYLQWLLSRTSGDLVVALAAYNSGPGALPPDWRTWVQRGGDALFCELIGRAETRDYVRLILGARQAYRELATPPTAP
jgi:soluble lytic murein transglycosylase-like protein